MNEQRIQKVTERGQITLPADWRRLYGANKNVVIRQSGSKLDVQPLRVEVDEFTVFDAIRDNQGKGIKAKDLVSMLNKMEKDK